MEEVSNITFEEAKALAKDFPLKPLRGKVIITVNAVEESGDVLLQESSFSDVQYVLAAAPNSGIKAGTKVLLDIERMTQVARSTTNAEEHVTSIKLKPVEVNGKIFALINDNVIDAIDER